MRGAALFSRPLVTASVASDAGIRLALAVLTVSSLWCAVFAEFPAFRAKIVRSPVTAVEGLIDVTVERRHRIPLTTDYAAIVWRVRNSSPVRNTLRLSSDSGHICAVEVPPGQSQRVDCAVATVALPLDALSLRVSAAQPSFILEYVEISTHYGGSHGLNRLYLIPSAQSVPSRPSLALLLMATMLIALLTVAPAWGHISRSRLLAALRIVVALVVLAVMGAPLVTQYRPVIAFHTWCFWSALLLLPQLLGSVRPLWTRALTRQGAELLACFAVAGLVGGAYVRATLFLLEHHEGNYSGFIHIHDQWFNRNPLVATRDDIRQSVRLEPSGYDAQFVYFGAFDPFLRAFRSTPERYRDVMDAAPYRYGRIGFIWLTRLAAQNDWRRFPAAMVWLVVVGCGFSALALALIARHFDASPLWAGLMLLIPGFWRSLDTALPEPVAAAFLLFGLLAALKQRLAIAGVLFGVAVLVRETTLILPALLVVNYWRLKGRRSAVALAILTVLPAIVWRLHLWSVLAPEWGGRAFFYSPGVHTIPLAGLVPLASAIAAGEYDGGATFLSVAAAWYAPLLVFGFVLTVLTLIRHRTPLLVATAIYGLQALSLDYASIWAHVGNSVRGTYEMFVLMAVVMVVHLRRDQRQMVAHTVFWVAVFAYMAFASLDSQAFRSALWLL